MTQQVSVKVSLFGQVPAPRRPATAAGLPTPTASWDDAAPSCDAPALWQSD